MESDPPLSLNAGKLYGLRPGALIPGLYWFRGRAERIDMGRGAWLHVVYRDLFKFYGFCLIAIAPQLVYPRPNHALRGYKLNTYKLPITL